MSCALVIALTVTAVVASATNKVRYDGYRVFRVFPVTKVHVRSLTELEKLGVAFWDGPNGAGRKSDLMLAPHQQTDLLDALRNSGIPMEEYSEDVQRLMDQEVTVKAKTVDDFTWDAYYTLNDIYAFLDNQALLHPCIATVVDYGRSYKGRDLKLIKIAASSTPKPAIFIESNFHANEWITNAVTTYIINELLNGCLQSELDSFDFYIVPVANPDGYEYTHTTDRTWRKTRSHTNSAFGCRGADPNRNWGFYWNTGGSSSDPCSPYYAGSSAFSEVEVRALAQYFSTVATSVVFYLSIHSYSQLILIPYSYTAARIPEYNEWYAIATKAAQALGQRYGTVFTAGNIVDLLYPASGASIDWIKGVYNTSLALGVELRDTGCYGFLLPADQIIPSALELMDALKVFFNYVPS